MQKNQKLLLFIFSFLCFAFTLNAQNLNPHSDHNKCRSQPSAETIEYIKSTLRERQSFQHTSRSGITYLPIRNIIVSRGDGTGGLSNANLNDAMNELNAVYLTANIQFFECSRKRVRSDRFFRLSVNDEDVLALRHEVPNVINIFYCKKIDDNSSTLGFAYFPNEASPLRDRIYMRKDATGSGEKTLIHEIGHYFGLLHTHDKFHGKEFVNGTNCNTAGDLICDTPADPNLNITRFNSNTCQYNGLKLDPNGYFYNPDVHNYMSYSSDNCMNSFTPTQIAHIQYSVANERNYLFCPNNSRTATFSSPISLDEELEVDNFESKTIEEITIYPNPTNRILNIDFAQFDEKQEITIKVVDMLGAIQFSKIETINNSETIHLSVENLAVGVYSLIIIGENNILTNKPFVVKR